MSFLKRGFVRRRLARLLWQDALERLPEMEKRDRRLADLFIRYRMQSSHLPYPAVRINAKVQKLQKAMEVEARSMAPRWRRGALPQARQVHRAALRMEDLQKQLARLLERVTTPSIRMNGHVLTPIQWHSKMMERQTQLGEKPDDSAFDPLVHVEISTARLGATGDEPPELHDAELLLLLGVGPVAVGKLGTEVDPSLADIWSAGDTWKPNA